MVNDAMSLAFFPKVMNSLKTNYSDEIKNIEKIAMFYYLFLFALAILLAFNTDIIINIISNENYAESSQIVSIIFIAFLIGGFYKIPTMILSYHKITKFYPYLSFFSFSINAALNFLLIPKYGVYGAAFATLIGTVLYSYIIQIMSFKYLSKEYVIVTTCFYIISFIVGCYFVKGIIL
jgi:O-antigen/teichoic acid export membrane protein